MDPVENKNMEGSEQAAKEKRQSCEKEKSMELFDDDEHKNAVILCEHEDIHQNTQGNSHKHNGNGKDMNEVVNRFEKNILSNCTSNYDSIEAHDNMINGILLQNDNCGKAETSCCYHTDKHVDLSKNNRNNYNTKVDKIHPLEAENDSDNKNHYTIEKKEKNGNSNIFYKEHKRYELNHKCNNKYSSNNSITSNLSFKKKKDSGDSDDLSSSTGYNKNYNKDKKDKLKDKNIRNSSYSNFKDKRTSSSRSSSCDFIKSSSRNSVKKLNENEQKKKKLRKRSYDRNSFDRNSYDRKKRHEKRRNENKIHEKKYLNKCKYKYKEEYDKGGGSGGEDLKSPHYTKDLDYYKKKKEFQKRKVNLRNEKKYQQQCNHGSDNDDNDYGDDNNDKDDDHYDEHLGERVVNGGVNKRKSKNFAVSPTDKVNVKEEQYSGTSSLETSEHRSRAYKKYKGKKVDCSYYYTDGEKEGGIYNSCEDVEKCKGYPYGKKILRKRTKRSMSRSGSRGRSRSSHVYDKNKADDLEEEQLELRKHKKKRISTDEGNISCERKNISEEGQHIGQRNEMQGSGKHLPDEEAVHEGDFKELGPIDSNNEVAHEEVNLMIKKLLVQDKDKDKEKENEKDKKANEQSLIARKAQKRECSYTNKEKNIKYEKYSTCDKHTKGYKNGGSKKGYCEKYDDKDNRSYTTFNEYCEVENNEEKNCNKYKKIYNDENNYNIQRYCSSKNYDHSEGGNDKNGGLPNGRCTNELWLNKKYEGEYKIGSYDNMHEYYSDYTSDDLEEKKKKKKREIQYAQIEPIVDIEVGPEVEFTNWTKYESNCSDKEHFSINLKFRNSSLRKFVLNNEFEYKKINSSYEKDNDVLYVKKNSIKGLSPDAKKYSNKFNAPSSIYNSENKKEDDGGQRTKLEPCYTPNNDNGNNGNSGNSYCNNCSDTGGKKRRGSRSKHSSPPNDLNAHTYGSNNINNYIKCNGSVRKGTGTDSAYMNINKHNEDYSSPNKVPCKEEKCCTNNMGKEERVGNERKKGNTTSKKNKVSGGSSSVGRSDGSRGSNVDSSSGNNNNSATTLRMGLAHDDACSLDSEKFRMYEKKNDPYSKNKEESNMHKMPQGYCKKLQGRAIEMKKEEQEEIEQQQHKQKQGERDRNYHLDEKKEDDYLKNKRSSMEDDIHSLVPNNTTYAPVNNITSITSCMKEFENLPEYIKNIINNMNSSYEMNEDIDMLNLNSVKSFRIPKFSILADHITNTNNFLKFFEKRKVAKKKWKNITRNILRQEFEILSFSVSYHVNEAKIDYITNSLKLI
ncbi:conserved Plasmodium protein, unknown function [Plasmodium malariae]|uniref:Uncharacterized protein n=1 Tax=Plasmodium malariae TaxID=5858 RepID=A0A1A8WVK3_PLAMA|nr:conserved Plasmodium protein, unknown function [Plasmodium malariae]